MNESEIVGLPLVPIIYKVNDIIHKDGINDIIDKILDKFLQPFAGKQDDVDFFEPNPYYYLPPTTYSSYWNKQLNSFIFSQ